MLEEATFLPKIWFEPFPSSHLVLNQRYYGVLNLERRPKLPKLPVYILETNHLLAAGLILLFLQRGYSLSQAGEELTQSLEGTDLESYVGTLQQSYNGRTRTRGAIFGEDSPWLSFPIPYAKIEEIAPRNETAIASQNLDLEALKGLLATIPQNDGLTAFSYQKVPIKKDAFRNIMFSAIAIAQALGKMEKPKDFENFLDNVNFLGFQRAVESCIVYMEKHPEIQNIEELCKAIKQKIPHFSMN